MEKRKVRSIEDVLGTTESGKVGDYAGYMRRLTDILGNGISYPLAIDAPALVEAGYDPVGIYAPVIAAFARALDNSQGTAEKYVHATLLNYYLRAVELPEYNLTEKKE